MTDAKRPLGSLALPDTLLHFPRSWKPSLLAALQAQPHAVCDPPRRGRRTKRTAAGTNAEEQLHLPVLRKRPSDCVHGSVETLLKARRKLTLKLMCLSTKGVQRTQL